MEHLRTFGFGVLLNVLLLVVESCSYYNNQARLSGNAKERNLKIKQRHIVGKKRSNNNNLHRVFQQIQCILEYNQFSVFPELNDNKPHVGSLH